jgi:GNAT superfamily N-acetyltransferase
VGFFEVDPRFESVASDLLDAASEWLSSRGCARAVGPLALNTWFPYRFRVDSESEHHFPWEPINPPAYPGLFARAGFTEVQGYHSVATAGLAAYAEKTRPAYEKAAASGFTFRPFDGAKLMEREVPLLHEISLKGFADNYLYEPIPLAAFRELYVPIANKMDFSYAFFVLSPEGKEVGFFFGFLQEDAVVLKSVTVLPEYRGFGLSNALSHLIAKRGVEHGATKYISALVRSGAQSESYGKKGETLWVHRYALYEKPLS